MIYRAYEVKPANREKSGKHLMVKMRCCAGAQSLACEL